MTLLEPLIAAKNTITEKRIECSREKAFEITRIRNQKSWLVRYVWTYQELKLNIHIDMVEEFREL